MNKRSKIIKKAWHVYHDNMIKPLAGHYYSIDELPIIYAKSANKAKMSNKHYAYDWAIDKYGNEPTYIDLKVVRVPNCDIILYNGQEMTLNEYKYHMELEKRNEIIKNLREDEYFYVQDARNYVGNAVLWWGKDLNGYVTDLKKAHKFTKQEILDNFLNGRDTDVIWIASHVEDAIREYVDSQYLLSKFSI